MTMALASGGGHLFGYTRLLSAVHDVFDAINLNTRVTGNWKDKPPDLPLAHRPVKPGQVDADGSTPDKRASVKDLFARFAVRT